ncbi:MAG TPA: LON peptidase substrate-binding domain-containing protein [Gemmatimonadales bacterium]|nr:LON peptidase substrate-binding domain-containing protein [Gemmatimonadales bacterium]
MPRELPIFPLPIVLFPGAPQPLHIFEPRYRQLLEDCKARDRRFGITYVARDESKTPDADVVSRPGDVGCVALIRSIQPLPDGRANILTVGERRFELRRWIERDPPCPYRVAEVEEFDDEPVDPAEVAPLAADVRAGFGRLARALSVLTEREDEPMELAQDPQLLSFQVAASLELDADAKRVLQTLRSTTVRLRQLAGVLGPLAADAERRAAVRQRAKRNGRGGRYAEIERAT